MKKVLILLGPPGAGKGTQAARLSEAASLPHVSTGDLFRENLAKGTEIGKRAQTYMDAGKLVPDDVVLEMLFARVAAPDSERGFLLDGFPRTIPQAEALENRLGRDASTCAMLISVPEPVLIERLTSRRTCKDCKSIYHLKFSPPKVAGRCDKCRGELIQRSDDSLPVVQNRLKVYRDQTEPLVAFYQARGVLRQVDGDQSEARVFAELEQQAFAGGCA